VPRSGDEPEIIGDQQGDQVPELLSAQLDPAAEVVNEPDAAQNRLNPRGQFPGVNVYQPAFPESYGESASPTL
jgi:hypothetical protein